MFQEHVSRALDTIQKHGFRTGARRARLCIKINLSFESIKSFKRFKR